MHQKKMVMEIFLFSMGKVSAKEEQALRKEKLRKDDNKYKQYLEKDLERRGKVRCCNKNDRYRKRRFQTKRKYLSMQLVTAKEKRLVRKCQIIMFTLHY